MHTYVQSASPQDSRYKSSPVPRNHLDSVFNMPASRFLCWTSSSPEVPQVPLIHSHGQESQGQEEMRLCKTWEQRKQTSIFKRCKSFFLLTLWKKKNNNMGICNYKAQNSFYRRKNMIHTSKDAQATAAICSCGPNPWKSKLREATVGLSECWTLIFAVLFLHTGQKSSLRSKEQVYSETDL